MDVAGERRKRVPTGELNRVVGEAVFRQKPPPVKNRRPKIFYATQAAVAPPTFVVFTSDAASVHFSYQRYLENRLRDAFGFDGTPIRLIFRDRRRVELERRAKPRNLKGKGPKVKGKPIQRKAKGAPSTAR
jgi:GTP-binding protein